MHKELAHPKLPKSLRKEHCLCWLRRISRIKEVFSLGSGLTSGIPRKSSFCLPLPTPLETKKAVISPKLKMLNELDHIIIKKNKLVQLHHQYHHNLHIGSPNFMHNPDLNSCNLFLLEVWNFIICKKTEKHFLKP